MAQNETAQSPVIQQEIFGRDGERHIRDCGG